MNVTPYKTPRIVVEPMRSRGETQIHSEHMTIIYSVDAELSLHLELGRFSTMGLGLVW